MWKWIYDGRYGALNGILLQLGWIDSYKIWLADPKVAMNFVIIAEIWKETPVGVLFILASLQTIPSSLYEAAKVDGASTFRRFIHITLPLLRPILLLLIVIKSVWAIRDSFDIGYMITRGGPAESPVFSYRKLAHMDRIISRPRSSETVSLLEAVWRTG